MKPEPLKDKLHWLKLAESRDQVRSDGYRRWYFLKSDVKLAMDWYKLAINETSFIHKELYYEWYSDNSNRRTELGFSDWILYKAFEDVYER